MRQFVIGDVHGECGLLEILWNKLEPDKDKDEVYFVGDLIDRGYNSKGVIDFIMERQAEGYNVVSVKGNHECMCLDAHEDQSNWGLWQYNGGNAALSSFDGEVHSVYLDFMEKLPLIVTTELADGRRAAVVHAGIPLSADIADINGSYSEEFQNFCLWARHEFYGEYDRSGGLEPFDLVVFGHTPGSKVTTSDDGKLVCIDTGAVFGRAGGYGRLTAYEMNSGKITQV